MSNPNAIARPKLTASIPAYDEDQQRTIARFLVAFLIDAKRMSARTAQMARNEAYRPILAAQLDYWRTAVSVARDLLKRVTQRQRHLTELTDQDISQEIPQWAPLLRSLFRQVPLERYVYSGPGTPTIPKPGSECASSRSANGRKRRPKRSTS